MSQHKAYLGDGVYVDREGDYEMVLTTSDGIEDTNTIHLDGVVILALLEWLGLAPGVSRAIRSGLPRRDDVDDHADAKDQGDKRDHNR